MRRAGASCEYRVPGCEEGDSPVSICSPPFILFRPSGAWLSNSSAVPRLSPWAVFCRRSAAGPSKSLALPTDYQRPTISLSLGTRYLVLGTFSNLQFHSHFV